MRIFEYLFSSLGILGYAQENISEIASSLLSALFSEQRKSADTCQHIMKFELVFSSPVS
jgi:hypothetical protein